MRFLFFGDSFTYGHGLDDCLLDDNRPGYAPSRLGWAHQLAQKYDVPYENLSLPGCSNQYMFYKMRTTPMTSDDFVIVQWGYYDRDFLLLSNGTLDPIGNWINSENIKMYYLLHSEHDCSRRSALTIEHAALWLTHQSIKWIFLANTDIPHTGKLITASFAPVWAFSGRDLCKDNGHPGPASNKAWAETVKGLIDDRLYAKNLDDLTIPIS